MTRTDLEHLIRAIGDMTNIKEVTIFGSQSILAQHPDLDNIVKSKNITMSPKKHDIDVLKRSMEADIYISDDTLANKIEFHMGNYQDFMILMDIISIQLILILLNYLNFGKTD